MSSLGGGGALLRKRARRPGESLGAGKVGHGGQRGTGVKRRRRLGGGGRCRQFTYPRADMSSSGAMPAVSSASSSAAVGILSAATAKTKTKKKHFVQQKVKVFRASDPLISVFMWGVNHSVNELIQVPVPVMLLPDDFKANSKIKVTNHLFNRENLPSHFKFKDYCPQVFRNLRERFGIDDQDFQASLTRSSPYCESEGHDGRFLLSYDKTLVIKEISSEDVADMHNILSHYHQHIVKCHGNTLLPQFLGMYRLSVDNEDSYIIVMRNMFSHRLTVHRKYDLKGSLVSREASDKEKFLVQLKLMDYSLLLGIHEVFRAEQEEEEELEEENAENECSPHVGSYGTSPEGIAGYLNSHKPLGPGEFEPIIDVYAIKSSDSAPQKEVYFMGLIDILTHYDAKKKAAHAAKTVKHGAGAEISTVHPDQYGKRFLEFVTNIFA
ncbi:phosphatidylinositol 5-phosphate 4-kinase type-2 gamma isoform X2 [Xenopus laevis]|uniref:Phosphatidylinositol 5-phosphate 4-kinase type-2 gamma n=1 Tax=Xenopus laevis TaxID=8355 RepID=A0A8J0UF94_XENLA|nr:phosphatidylinositol 5-phosphate 4-kinase type-2 gamma isoform X2 [Xenopus laevis]